MTQPHSMGLSFLQNKSLQVLLDCDWYVAHCFNELADMGVVDRHGAPCMELKTLVGPPNVQQLRQAKLEKKENTGDEPDKGTVAEYCPWGAGFQELHRNFTTWRQVPPGWKRRLIAEASDIALGNHYLTNKILV
jgi:hypothetical protein